MTLSTVDLFTDEEYDTYISIVNCINEINGMTEEDDPAVKQNKILEKKEHQKRLAELIEQHKDVPRTVRLKSVLDTRWLEKDSDGNVIWPEGITWKALRVSKKISEFVSDESRTMGLKANDVTFDKIIIKWKSLDILEQIVMNGYYLPVLNDDGTVTNKHHIFVTASAGQLRTDKIQTIEEETWNRISEKLLCGLNINSINKLGINVNKLQAYIALCSSATEPWPELDIDKCIVVDDMETEVEGLVDYLDEAYNMTRQVMKVPIKHTDGVGMMLPRVSRKNKMIRGPWL